VYAGQIKDVGPRVVLAGGVPYARRVDFEHDHSGTVLAGRFNFRCFHRSLVVVVCSRRVNVGGGFILTSDKPSALYPRYKDIVMMNPATLVEGQP